MHHVRVSLDLHHVGQLDRAELGHPADVVAAQVDEHDVLGPFLGIGQELLGQGPSSASSAPAPRPASGRIVTMPSSTRTRISGELPIRAKSPNGR